MVLQTMFQQEPILVSDMSDYHDRPHAPMLQVVAEVKQQEKAPTRHVHSAIEEVVAIVFPSAIDTYTYRPCVRLTEKLTTLIYDTCQHEPELIA